MPAKKTPPTPPNGFNPEQFDQLCQWLKAKYPELSTDALIAAAATLYQSMQVTKGIEQAERGIRSTMEEYRSRY